MSDSPYLGNSINVSLLKDFSIGEVGANKDEDDDIFSLTIEVKPSEVLKFLNGEITDNVQTLQAQGTQLDGEEYTSTVDVTKTIKATWLSLGNSNRITAPNVRRGEKVMIYVLGDTNTYFWDTLENHIKLRRLETVIYAFSGEPSLNKEASIENKNVYFLQISTHMKNILLQTSKANGEPHEWTLELDTDKSTFTITDDDENYFTIQSKQRLLELRNGDGTFFRLNGPNIEYHAVGNMTGLVDKNKDLTVKGNDTSSIDGNTSISTQGNTSVSTQGNTNISSNGSSRVHSNGGNSVTSPSGISLDAPGIGFMGSVYSRSGSYGGSGEMELQGSARFLNNVSITGTLDVTGHTHLTTLSVDNIPW
ncbi:MAG: hypothetical protein M0R77_00480 [Gammaproteobacteria bacterium]|nr:hypothetical protein [Acholeplasmataceae bacterium]MCK9529030.1 hypothetical protein [Gammaproteobacteria bacterium]